MTEKVNHPVHYNRHPSGVEAIEIIEHMNFCLGNAFKYLFRYRLKGGHEDINKAIWYLERQLTNPEIPPSNVPKEIQAKIDLFLSSEKNKYLKPVYENIISYQFHGFHPKSIWESIELLHHLEDEAKAAANHE